MSTQVRFTADSDGERTLEQALSVTPSPDFVARVRERLREEPMRSTSHRWPAVAFAGALMAAIILAVGILERRPGAGARGRRQPGCNPCAGEGTGGGAQRGTCPRPVIGSARPTSRSGLARAAPPPLTVRRAPAREEAREVLISGDERRMLDRFLIAMREGRVVVPAPRRVLEDGNGLLLEPRPIEIPPMRPIEPLPVTAADRSGSRDR